MLNPTLALDWGGSIAYPPHTHTHTVVDSSPSRRPNMKKFALMTLGVGRTLGCEYSSFEDFAHKYGKVYHPSERSGRRANWEAAKGEIAAHNARTDTSWTAGLNEFADEMASRGVSVVQLAWPGAHSGYTVDQGKANDWKTAKAIALNYLY